MGYLCKVKGYIIPLDLFLIKFIETCLTKSVDSSRANSNCFLREARRQSLRERPLWPDCYHKTPTSKEKLAHLQFQLQREQLGRSKTCTQVSRRMKLETLHILVRTHFTRAHGWQETTRGGTTNCARDKTTKNYNAVHAQWDIQARHEVPSKDCKQHRTIEEALTGPGVTYMALTAYTSTQILATTASQWLSKRQHGKIIF